MAYQDLSEEERDNLFGSWGSKMGINEIDYRDDLLRSTMAQLAKAKQIVKELFEWQSEISELMPDGMSARICDLLGDDVVDSILGLDKDAEEK